MQKQVQKARLRWTSMAQRVFDAASTCFYYFVIEDSDEHDGSDSCDRRSRGC